MKPLELEEKMSEVIPPQPPQQIPQSLVPQVQEKKKEDKDKKKTFWERLWKVKKLEKGMVAVIYLKESGIADTLEVPSVRGFFNINGRTYHERRDCTYTFGKDRHPLAIIPEWNLTPLGRKEWEDKEMQEKCAVLQDHVMKGIRHAERVRSGENMGMGKLNPKVLITGAIAAVIIISVLMNYI